MFNFRRIDLPSRNKGLLFPVGQDRRKQLLCNDSCAATVWEVSIRVSVRENILRYGFHRVRCRVPKCPEHLFAEDVTEVMIVSGGRCHVAGGNPKVKTIDLGERVRPVSERS